MSDAQESTRRGPWKEDDSHRFAIWYALGLAFPLVRGLRKQVTDDERQRMAQKILDYIKLCGYRITKDPWHAPEHSVPCQVVDARREES